MAQISFRLSDALLEALEAEADDRGVSRAKHIRDALESRHEADELRRENERLRNEKRALVDQREEHTELVRYVEDEQRYRQAGVVTRFKWWLRGMD